MSLGIINFKPCSPLLMFVRYGHRLRGKRPGVAKSLAQRLEGEFHHRSQNCSRFSCHRRFRHKNLFRNIFFPIAEGRREDPELCRKNDIGFPFLRPARSAELKQRLEQLKAIRKDPNLEQLARKNKCKKFLKVLCDLAADFFLLSLQVEINMDEAKQNWMKTAGPFHIRKIAEHYGVFEHLFGKHAFFTPRVWMEINVSRVVWAFSTLK